jgi:hypothetical protein
MPAFGSIYSDAEIAAVANYVTGRFGSAPSKILRQGRGGAADADVLLNSFSCATAMSRYWTVTR